jgi:hypothetical protein
MKYLKLYEQFRLILEADESSKYIIPYPSNQKFDEKKKSIILVPGGDKGNPENDYSKIAPSLLDSYNVYSFSWPQNINIKEFADKIVSQIDEVVKTPFCLVGYSFGVPICWRMAQKLEGNKNYKNIIISIDGTMLVSDQSKHMYNSLSGNPPRKLSVKRLDFYKSELGEGEVKESDDVIKQFYYEFNPKITLYSFDKLRQNSSSAKIGEDIIWSSDSEKEYQTWKSGKTIFEFIDDKKTPTLDDINKLDLKGKKEDQVWIVCDKETDGKTPLYVRAIKSSIEFFDDQEKTKTGFVLDKGEKLNNTKVIGIIALDTKVGTQEVKNDNEVILTKKDGLKEIINVDWVSKSQKLIGVAGCDHNTICDGKTSDVINIIKDNF